MRHRVAKQYFICNRTMKSGDSVRYSWYQDIAPDYKLTEKETEQRTKANQSFMKRGDLSRFFFVEGAGGRGRSRCWKSLT